MGQGPDRNELFDKFPTSFHITLYDLVSVMAPVPIPLSVNKPLHWLYTANTKLSTIVQLPESRENIVLESRLCFMESSPINHLCVSE